MTVSDQVRNLLSFSKDARNSDKELYILYLQRSGMNLSEQQINLIKEMPSFETITRVRRKIQETEPELRASDFIRKERGYKAMRMQQVAPKASPKYVERIIDGERFMVEVGVQNVI